MGGTMGLTDAQKAKMTALSTKATPLTAIQAAELAELQRKECFVELPKGAQSYCLKWIKEQLYMRRQEFSSKYTQKGNEVEAESIEFIGRMMGLSEFDLATGRFQKNDVYMENEYMTGTSDVVPEGFPNLIVDAKNSWDCFTLPFFDTELKDDGYWWQGQGYMDLWGRSEYHVTYTLLNTPESIIESEMRKYAYSNGIDVEDLDYADFEAKFTYDNIMDELKIKTFKFERDDKAIEDIKARVIECRKFIDKVIQGLSPAIKARYEITPDWNA